MFAANLSTVVTYIKVEIVGNVFMNTYTAPFRNPLISDNAVTYFPEASKLFTSVTSVAILTRGSRDMRIFTKFTPCRVHRAAVAGFL